MPIIQPNNTTGLYGVDTTVSVGNTLFATNLNISNNAVVGNNITAGNTITAGNDIVAGGEVQATGNITTAGFFVGNFAGNITGNVTVPGANTQVLYNNAGNIGTATGFTFTNTNGELDVPGAITAVGNIQGNYILGNGSQLTGLPAAYSNANVSAFMATFGSNTINSTGNITTTANISGGFILGNGSQLTGVATTLPSATTNQYLRYSGTAWAAADLDIANDLSPNLGGNLNAGNFEIFNAGNIQTNGFYTGNGGFISNISGSNVNGPVAVATTAGTVSGNAQANITSVGTLTSLSVSGNITSSGNVSGNFILGNGSQLTGLPATYGNANVVTLLAGFGSNTVSTTGNITAGLFLGNGSALTGITATATPAGANTELQFNDAGATGASANLTFNKTSNTLITTNANIGNVSIVGSTINNINPFDASQNPNPFRVIYGNGYNGDYSANSDPLGAIRNSLLTIQTKQTSTTSDTNHGVRGYGGITYNDLNGQTHTNNARRGAGSGSVLWVGNGTVAMTAVPYLGAVGAGGTVLVGNVGTVSMGNATIGHAAGSTNLVISGAGANIGNAVGALGQIQINAANANVTTAIGVGTQFVAGTAPTVLPTTVIGYYMPNATATYGLSSGNGFRGAANYYFLRNDDAVAQNQLGSLRSYTEFNGVSGTTSGSLTIDKNAGQVQQVNLTGNVSSLAYSNFVSSASDGTNTDEQSDTVTIVFNQGATGNFGVTFPTGSQYLYAGNIKALQSVAANSVSLVSVSAVRISGTTTYLTTISPGFVQ